jgi:hypothetical protein
MLDPLRYALRYTFWAVLHYLLLHPTELRLYPIFGCTYWATLNRPEGTMHPSELRWNLLSHAAIKLGAPPEICCNLLSYAAAYWAALHPIALSYAAPYWASLELADLRCTFWATLTLWAILHSKYATYRKKLNAGLTGIRSFSYWNAKNADTVGNLFVSRILRTESDTGKLWNRTEIVDAGMPMPAASASKPESSYTEMENSGTKGRQLLSAWWLYPNVGAQDL